MSIQWIVQLAFLILIHWIKIYPMDSVIQLLNNWELKAKRRNDNDAESGQKFEITWKACEGIRKEELMRTRT